MLPSLLLKAATDAGFDLVLREDSEWTRIGVSGLDGRVWLLPVRGGALIAVDSRRALGDLDTVTWTDVPLPPGAAGAARYDRPADVFEALRIVRVLLQQQPPRPEKRLAQRIAALGTTEVERIVRQRVGQDLFREMMLDYWDGRCAVTGLAVPALLRASHAKPWAAGTDEERLDVHNGFLLAVHLDALFDRGLMTFGDDGRARFNSALPEEARQALLGHSVLGLSRVADGHLPYLEYHRSEVFEKKTRAGPLAEESA